MNIEIHETTDYTIFKTLKGNRDVKSVNKIIESIGEVGYIPSPLCCNENMEVIDGQNRLAALKRLELPVHYYIVRGIGIREARQMDIGRKNWKSLDYVNSYADTGNENFIRFRNLMNESGYPVQELYAICKGLILQGGSSYNTPIKKGTFTLTREEAEKARDIIETLDEILPALKKVDGSRRLLVSSFAWILRLDKVSKKRLVKTVLENYPLFVPAVKAELTLRDFSEFYNKRYSKPIWFDLEYRKSRFNDTEADEK